MSTEQARVPLLDPDTGLFPDRFAPASVAADAAAAASSAGVASSAASTATQKAADAETARVAAVAARAAAEAVPAQVDAAMASVAADPTSAFATLQSATIAGTNGSILTRPFPRVLAHRAGFGVYPENSVEAMAATFEQGFEVETDVARLSDGTLVILHDATTGRTMTGPDVAPETLTLDQWRARKVKPRYTGGKYGTPPVLRDILTNFRGQPFTLEIKDSADRVPLFALVRSLGLIDSVLFASQAYSEAKLSASMGVHVTYGATNTSTPVATLVADHITAIHLPIAADTAYISACVNAGIIVYLYYVTSRAQIDTIAGLGVGGYETDYAERITQRYGQAGREEFRDYLNTSFTGFTTDWKLEHTIDGFRFVWSGALQDTLAARLFGVGDAPMSTRYLMRARFLAASLNQSRWIGINIGVNNDAADVDLPLVSSYGNRNMYAFFIKRDGGISIERRAGTVQTAIASGVHAAWATAGARSVWLDIEIVITDTTVTMTILNDGTTLTATDTTFRPADSSVSISASGTGFEYAYVKRDLA